MSLGMFCTVCTSSRLFEGEGDAYTCPARGLKGFGVRLGLGIWSVFDQADTRFMEGLFLFLPEGCLSLVGVEEGGVLVKCDGGW